MAWRRVIVMVTVVVFALLAVLVLRSTPDVAAIVRWSTIAERRIASAEELWDSYGIQNAADIAALLDEASRALIRSRERAESTPFLRYIPIARSALAAATTAADAGSAYVNGARGLLRVFADGQERYAQFEGRSFAGLTKAERASVISFAGDALARSRAARDDFARGDILAARVPCPLALRLFVRCTGDTIATDVLRPRRLSQLRDDLSIVIAVGESFIAFAGSGTPRDILLLFLNNTEIRPGGGFLGTYGLARIQRGEIMSFQTDDVYNLDRFVEGIQRIVPPEPFRRQKIAQHWYLRDANWSPDFKVSTETVLDFYRRERGPGNPEIVVGFTPSLAASLLRIVGVVTINGVRYDSVNIVDELEYQVEKGYDEQGIPRPQRKAIVTPLAHAVASRLLERPIRDWRPVLEAIRVAIRERQLMAYAVDEEVQAAFERFDVAGRVRNRVAGDDALMVVDANLGALKTDPVVERAIRYTITPDGDGFRGIMRLRYRNTGTFSWKTTRYRTYTRAYLPSGTEFVRAIGAMVKDRSDEPGPVDVGTDLGRTVFGAFVSIEPGQTRDIEFEFRLATDVAARIRNNSYALDVQKQLGSVATQLTLDLDFGKLVQSANPPESPAAWGDTRYFTETDLREDRRFTVQLAH